MASHELGEHRGRRQGNGAAGSLKCRVADIVARIQINIESDLVAAQRVVARGAVDSRLDAAEIAWIAAVVENGVPIQTAQIVLPGHQRSILVATPIPVTS